MRILFISPRYYPHVGGVEYVVKSITERLAKMSHDITVLASEEDLERPREEEINDIRVIRWPVWSPAGAYHIPQLKDKLFTTLTISLIMDFKALNRENNWARRRDDQLPRVVEAMKIIQKYKLRADVYADLGCGDGAIAEVIAKAVGAKTVYCVDISEEGLMKAREKGQKTYRVDLSLEKLPFKDESIDLITTFEVIEHLINPDNMLKEIYRVLRRGGYLLLSTPNLASWVNRIIFLLGFQPYNAEVSTEIIAGTPIKSRTFAKPSGHIRPFTLKALKELLIYHKFKVVNVRGAPGVEPKELQILDKLFSKTPSLARRLVVLAQKP